MTGTNNPPATSEEGDRRLASWASPSGNRVHQLVAQPDGSSTPPLSHPADVIESLRGRFQFIEGSSDGTLPGLRPPQIGAVHSVLGYWASVPTQPATVVMPTGTGKTDTMIALLVAARLERLLVIVPTDALRIQLADKFETYGVLTKTGVLDDDVPRLIVGRIEHSFPSPDEATDFARRCNVIITTVHALSASREEAREALLNKCTHLFVDEAHHIAAPQWIAIREYFPDRTVVQFTATPFRADGKHLGGRLIFAYPLREAQAQGFFSRIDYIPVTDFFDPDLKIATTAVERLEADIAAGFDHLLMARVKRTRRADEVVAVYKRIASKWNPVMIHSGESLKERRAALGAVAARTSRIIVCVDMLGEGYDLPSLKIAAIHDAHKSLPVTLQFIGRFARVSPSKLGDACVVVNRPDPEYDESLRQLYADDADWNLVLREAAEAAVGAEQKVSDFEAAFGSSLPEEVPIRTLAPKMSTVVYRTYCMSWDPDAALDLFGAENLLTSTIAVNRQRNVAWFVTAEHHPVRWGTLKTVEEVAYNLYVLYWDAATGLLYINSSNNGSVHKRLAEAVCGDTAEIIKGESVYRVMGRINRLMPTNVGLIDTRSRARRFSKHVGADVSEGFPVAEAQTKTKTDIFASGYERGDRISFGGSLKGRVWSRRAAHSLSEWADWCDRVGAKLVDEAISVDEVMRGFIRPQLVQSRPTLVVLGVDWPYELYFNTSDKTSVSYKGTSFPLVDAELRVDEHTADGPVTFSVVTPTWSAPHEAAFTKDGIEYRALDSDVTVLAPRSTFPLVSLFNELGLKFYFENETTVEHGGFLLRPPRNTPPFLKEKLVALDWSGINIKNESQGPTRESDSIQYHAIQRLLAEQQWDIVIDDDGSGEAADVVALAVDGDELLIRLTHCKFSSEPTPGARVEDLYELCGQAHKSVVWKRAQDLVDHLIHRERNRRARHGHVGFQVGDEVTLKSLQHRVRSLRPRLEITIVQPGLSAAKVSQAQLQLLACAEVYVYETAMAKFEVVCSA